MQRQAPIANHHRSRAGSLSVEISIGFVGVALVAALLGSIAVSRKRAALQEQRSADLETAQNLVSDLRAGRKPALPEGWELRRLDVDGHAVLELRAPSGARLRTLEDQP